jgi:DNA polymerase-3 subunit alpha
VAGGVTIRFVTTGLEVSRWFNAHAHSNFSSLDGMPKVQAMVDKSVLLDYPAFVLTDHGNMAGTVQAYKATSKLGMPFFPGVEAYLLDPSFDGDLKDAGKVGRYHIGIMALDLKGYQALIKFVSKTHTRPRFSRFPRCTLSDLAELSQEAGDHVAVTTGCFFGYVQQTILREGEKRAIQIVRMLAQWFPHTFVELQNHGIDHVPEGDDVFNPSNDDMMNASLVNVADKTGLPILATQDSHYCDQRQKHAHALMKRMVYGGVEDAFPGDSFHIASDEWVAEHYKPEVWDRAVEGCDELLSLHDLKIPPLDKFQTHVPSMDAKPNTTLKRKCEAELKRYLKAKGLLRQRKEYEARLDHEYTVIKNLGMSNYFLFVLDGVTWCRRKGFAVEARGSANGSLVCFLLGITQIDPIKYGTLFERFLSPDRTSNPDIDIDIEDIARPFVLGYRSQHFETLQIGTFSELGAREIDGKGSVIATYQQYLRRTCIDRAKDRERKRAEREGDKAVMGKAEQQGKADFNQKYGWIKTLDDVKEHNEDDYYDLIEIARMKSVRKSYGVHASGVLVAGFDMKIEDWVPSMLVASSDTHVTQYDMKDVEEFGMLKEDWLGQKTLAIMRRCQELIMESAEHTGDELPVGMDPDDPTYFGWIPEDDPEACKLLREGRTENGIFHFEGYTKAKGGKEMGIQSTMDAVLATALYMPGATESGQKDHYLKYRKSSQSPKYLHPIFEEAMKDTYGAVIYQEQPLAICRALGMSIESINRMFKIVKDSGKGAVERNKERLKEFRDEFDDLALKAGFKESQLDEAWFMTTGFINYGFNRAHASGYGLRSYRCAYLKAHYALEFMAAILENWAGDKKEPIYVREARRIGIRILPPDVNISGAIWTLDRTTWAIRRGLSSIAGVGPAAAEEIAAHAPYDRVIDVAKRCNPKRVTGGKAWLDERKLIGTLRKLEDAGAMDDIEH